jgi:hypothetical protein
VVAVNRDKVDSWKADVARSVDFYNEWFMAFAPQAFRETRIETTKQVELALQLTENLTNIRPETLLANPAVLPMLTIKIAAAKGFEVDEHYGKPAGDL